MVGAVFFGVVAMVAAVMDVVWCSAVAVVVAVVAVV